MQKYRWFFSVIAVSFLVLSIRLYSRPWRVTQIPNGNTFACAARRGGVGGLAEGGLAPAAGGCGAAGGPRGEAGGPPAGAAPFGGGCPGCPGAPPCGCWNILGSMCIPCTRIFSTVCNWPAITASICFIWSSPPDCSGGRASSWPRGTSNWKFHGAPVRRMTRFEASRIVFSPSF